jgi:O-antigen/teichoic acid export membrane protein
MAVTFGCLPRYLPELPRNGAAVEYVNQSVWRLVGYVFPVGSAFVIMSLYQRVGVFLLDRTAGSIAVASYGTAFSMVTVPGFFSVSIASVFFPAMSREIVGGNRDVLGRVFAKGVTLVAVLYALGSVLGVLCAPTAVSLLLPVRFESVTTVAQVLLPGLYISTINVYLKYSLNALGRNAVDAVASASGILVFAAALWWPHWVRPDVGAAVSWNLGELAIFAIRSFAIRTDGRIPSGILLTLLAGYPCVCMMCYYLATLAVES